MLYAAAGVLGTVMSMELSTPSALLVGDTHANARWMENVVLPNAAAQGVQTVIVVGDFGYWQEASRFLQIVNSAKERFGLEVWFLDGNHEQHSLLAHDAAACRVEGDEPRSPVRLGESLVYLPRGAVVEVAGLSVLAMGGAASIDRLQRHVGVDWFYEELLSDADIAAGQRAALGLGGVDVLLCHDAPAGWTVPGLIPYDHLPSSWARVLPECWDHRRRLADVYAVAEPKMVVHGHYHSAYELEVDEDWGAVRVVGLNCDGSAGWGRVLSAADGRPLLGDRISPMPYKKPSR